MKYANAYELADAHVTDILAIIKVMGQRGVRVDPDRLAAFNVELDNQLEALSKKFAADPVLSAIGGFHPSEGYKRTPSKKITCVGCAFTPGRWVNEKGRTVKCPVCRGSLLMHVADTEGLELVEFPIGEGETVNRWAKREPFLPTSGDHVKEYMRRKGHSVPFDKKGDETTATKQLLVAARKYKDSNYRDFTEYRKIKKLRGTYGNWPMQRRGPFCYVTTKFSLKPDTHRLSSIAPNVQNIPKDGPLAKMFRSCLVPSPGCRFIKSDLSSAEALVTGWLANDADYMRLATIGTHKYVMARYLGMPVSMDMGDAELKEALKDVKDKDPRLYRQMKIVVYGGTYLSGAKTMYLNNPEDFAAQGDAQKLLNFVNGLSPKVQMWKRQVMSEAQRMKGLTNPFGYYKPFWDLPGNDGPASVAYKPQSIVAAVMKEIMLQLWPLEAGQFMVWQIHDELIFDTPESLIEVVKTQVLSAFTQPWAQLGGLKFGCSLDVVDSLGD